MNKGYCEGRSRSSCAACKLLKRKCRAKCIFAPYFRSEESKKFAQVHKVFGASNVSKILFQVPEHQRQDAVNSLAYEAEARLKDPVYGCIGPIALLHNKMLQLHHDLALAKATLAHRASASASYSSLHHHDIFNNYDNALNKRVPVVTFGNSRFDPTPNVDAEQQLQSLVRRKAQCSGPAPPHVTRQCFKRRVRRRFTRGHRDALELLQACGVEGNGGWFEVTIPNGLGLGLDKDRRTGQVCEMVEKLCASNSVADAVVDPNGESGGTVVEPRELKHEGRRSVENVRHVEGEEFSPVSQRFGRLLEVRRRVRIRDGLDEERTLGSTHHLETRAIRCGSDPTGEREIRNQGCGQCGFERSGKGVRGWGGPGPGPVDEEVFDGETKEELRINGGESEDRGRSRVGRSYEESLCESHRRASHVRRFWRKGIEDDEGIGGEGD
ncbi:LOB domain-containing protein 21-like [Senna tora]|uniref:LOB domain-containing protein 21-like n=1 Tax=Senna tora TaxID=362788 RepID=A0A834U4D4_9FABA|nr:LOB domain-containing protein 21-like [Senna tora]